MVHQSIQFLLLIPVHFLVAAGRPRPPSTQLLLRDLTVFPGQTRSNVILPESFGSTSGSSTTLTNPENLQDEASRMHPEQLAPLNGKEQRLYSLEAPLKNHHLHVVEGLVCPCDPGRVSQGKCQERGWTKCNSKTLHKSAMKKLPRKKKPGLLKPDLGGKLAGKCLVAGRQWSHPPT